MTRVTGYSPKEFKDDEVRVCLIKTEGGEKGPGEHWRKLVFKAVSDGGGLIDIDAVEAQTIMSKGYRQAYTYNNDWEEKIKAEIAEFDRMEAIIEKWGLPPP